MTDTTVDTTSLADVSGGITDGRAADSLLVDIVERLAAARGDDPLDLPPLNDYIDVDALATLFKAPAGGQSAAFGSVTFRVEEHEVRIYQDRTIYVHRPGNGDRSSALEGSF
ncbi:HalOD1 output domain-containing protein [Halomarina salina]|uniref:HalOD1 output domain-containing protein n=1 Tax=Halomarina salina TaxID=1872699 RepID=A0ABD5RNM9_9EURY|nr:HalOD1 output domain-containing protein [Halomarina salina]